MTPPVNLDNLRELTGGDAHTEKNLFQVFCQSAAECITDLQRHTGPDHAEIWRRKAHALKGICLNLGAARLSTLCKQAQDGFMRSAAEKKSLLALIAKEYEHVKTFLEAQD